VATKKDEELENNEQPPSDDAPIQEASDLESDIKQRMKKGKEEGVTFDPSRSDE
jgi:hypothetical protein